MLRSPGGKKREKQPLRLSTILRYYIQPVVKRLGTNKRVTWHTFRRTYTTLLHANGEGAPKGPLGTARKRLLDANRTLSGCPNFI
jgi:hypothetical protein